MYRKIIKKYPAHTGTCPLENLRDGCITFVRDINALSLLIDVFVKDVVVLAPLDFKMYDNDFLSVFKNYKFEFVDNVDYVFTMVHNELNRCMEPKANIIGDNCWIHPMAVVGVEGTHTCKAPDGKRIQLRHMGNVVLCDNVEILAFATIQRGVFNSTILKSGVKIDSHVNIGHNSVIGKNSVLALGAIVGGSVKLGENCMVGLGAILRNGIKICDDVIIGMGSNVVKDIDEPGIYMGNPAKYFKPYENDWNF